MPTTWRNRLRNKPPPTSPLPALRRMKKKSRVLNRCLASAGHRGRADARGQRGHRATGLTRMSDRGAGVPSRDGRSAAPATLDQLSHRCPARRVSLPYFGSGLARSLPRRAHAVPVRTPQASHRRPSREGTPTTRPDVRVKPGAPPIGWPRASTRPRWPVDAKDNFQNCGCFSSPAKPSPR